MHVHVLPKERVPIAPRTLKEPALHSIPLVQLMSNKYFKMQWVPAIIGIKFIFAIYAGINRE